MHQSIIGTLNMLKLERKGQAKCAGVLAGLLGAGRAEIFLIAPQTGRAAGLGKLGWVKNSTSSAFSYTY